jgi:hypothetical protein
MISPADGPGPADRVEQCCPACPDGVLLRFGARLRCRLCAYQFPIDPATPLPPGHVSAPEVREGRVPDAGGPP